MDDICILIKESGAEFDKYGNEKPVLTRRQVFCQVYGITRSEFYNAAQAKLTPELTFRLSEAADYEGENTIEYNGQEYSIIRVYRDSGSLQHTRGLPPNAVELIAEKKIGDEKGGSSE